MGIPDKDTQERYAQSHQRALEKRNKYFNNTSAVKPVDLNSLSPEGRAFRQNIGRFNEEVSQIDSILGRLRESVRLAQRRQIVSFDIAKKVVWEIFAMELARKNKGVWFTPEQEEVLDNVIRYFIADQDCPYSPHKGLFIYGPYGVGKTWLFKIMLKLCKVVPIPEMDFAEVPTKRLIKEYTDFKESKDKKVDPLNKYAKGHLLLNDFGEEKQTITTFKDESRPMDLLLSERNEVWDNNGHLTHITSNLGLGESESALEDQLENIYGTRILDRFKDMFEVILLPGESKRG